MRHALALIVAVSACGPARPAIKPPPEDRTGSAGPAITPPDDPTPVAGKSITNRSLDAIGLDPGALDRNADPCDDFYQFACGGWMARTEIAADKPMANRSFVAIGDRNLEYLHGVLEQMRAAPGADPINQQLAAYYGSCMDEAAIEAAGTRPLAPLRAVIDRVRDAASLSAAIAQGHAAGFDLVFSLGQLQDSADATKVIAGIDQGGLGLPDREYYLLDEHKLLRAAYERYVATMLAELGAGPDAAKRDAARILDLELQIAKVSKDKVARRDPKATYNKLDKAGVAKAMPHLDWAGYWKTVGLAKQDGVTVTSPEFLAGVDALLGKVPAEVWRAYLTFHLGSRAAPFLTPKIAKAQFDFSSALTGQPEMPVRWKRCVAATDRALGDLVGQVFVRDRFAGASKTAAEAQIAAVTAAMTANLAGLAWMDADTKARANAKLRAMTFQIGYPNKWRSYAFKLDPKAYGANALAARKAERARQLDKIGKPLDRDDWLISAPTVDAYYDPQLNGMVFPAGILQPPFYSVDASTPVSLGAIGVIVGHELTHGFDDQGAQYDAAGNLVNWWQPATEQQFKTRTACVAAQYGQYTVAGGTPLNGANTLGENIADIGGVKLALAAYRALRAGAPDAVLADGFTEDQQFFLGFGQAWCAKARPDFEKLLATVDVHSPPRWRVNGSLSATPEFAKAFRCKAGAKMVPAKQCTVW